MREINQACNFILPGPENCSFLVLLAYPQRIVGLDRVIAIMRYVNLILTLTAEIDVYVD